MKIFDDLTKHKLIKGGVYTLNAKVTKNNLPVNLDDLDELNVSIYSYNDFDELVQYNKSQLIISDPTSGNFEFSLSSEITSSAKTTLYVIEIEFSSVTLNIREIQKGYLATFCESKLK